MSSAYFAKPGLNAYRDNMKPTILFVGLTARHDALMAAAMHGAGYPAEAVPTPTRADLQAGRDLGNPGQCNPVHFNAGAVVHHLCRLESQGMSRETLCRQYVFVTAGACGPCRYGMYEAEYRRVLANAGFGALPVVTFQQFGEFEQSDARSGLRLDAVFFFSLIAAVAAGDVLIALGHRLRPYTLEPQRFEHALDTAAETVAKALSQPGFAPLRGGALARALGLPLRRSEAQAVATGLRYLARGGLAAALRTAVRDALAEIEFDYTRVRPLVKTTGEFWAQTTRGDGNYGLFEFVEREGGEIWTEPVTAWLDYCLWQALGRIDDAKNTAPWRKVLAQIERPVPKRGRRTLLYVAQRLLHREYNRCRRSVGTDLPALPDQQQLAQLADPHYSRRLTGGEGHLEIAEHRLCAEQNRAHLVLSIKPFGCLPSTQSDGAQAGILAQYEQSLFLSVETSGEGEAGAWSRAQMMLTEAKTRAQDEFNACLAQTGHSLEDIQAYAARTPELRRATLCLPRYPGVAGTAARFVVYVAECMAARGKAAHHRADVKANTRTTSTHEWIVGLDIGSTTVKAVVLAPHVHTPQWKTYRRHSTRLAETAVAVLEEMACAFPDVAPDRFRVFATGSGAGYIAERIGAAFVQEVTAVATATERLHPGVRTVAELGGQDAKLLFFKDSQGRRTRHVTMNDKCAGGTGAVIDKLLPKLGLSFEEAAAIGIKDVRTHPVAGKCGVFAETDINGLQKSGVPANELLASLFEALVQQNLSVLARGHLPRPEVLLLGGPHHFFPGLRQVWRVQLERLWQMRGVELPKDHRLEDLVHAPEDAHYYAAIGAAEYGRGELLANPDLGLYRGVDTLRAWMRAHGGAHRRAGLKALVQNPLELEAFRLHHAAPEWRPAAYRRGAVVEAFLGLDGGSTSTKAVLIDSHRRVLDKAYRLSRGNPVEDAAALFDELTQRAETYGARLHVAGAVVTGYAKELLRAALNADAALVETVAHARGGLHVAPGIEVICDAGGQDIKIITLRGGDVKDFRLNTQCSAGNGYFLQSAAALLGKDLAHYADAAFAARTMPEFGYGCAVFLQTDLVDVQREGWTPEEILAGLAAVLPKNIWLHVARTRNLPALGRSFLLQGGTHLNLAVVKAQCDFIAARFAETGIAPQIAVHPHCGEAGALGCALEALRLASERRGETSFIGLDAARTLRYRAERNESTRCSACMNRCERTFLHFHDSDGAVRRGILAPCDRGAQDTSRPHRLREDSSAPDFAAIAAHEAFLPTSPRVVARAPNADRVRIGLPRVLSMYALGPFVMGLFQSLGISPRNLVWSPPTTLELFQAGAARASIDPCFPAKLAIPHVQHLLDRSARGKSLSHIFLPIVDALPQSLGNALDSRSCPAAAATPESVHAAFLREGDAFARAGVLFKKTFLDLRDPTKTGLLFHADWGADLGVSAEDCIRACDEGLRALEAFRYRIETRAAEALQRLEREGRVGVMLLARPYHADPGVQHGIGEAFARLGYPVFTPECLPAPSGSLDALWPHTYCENSNRKLWAAQFAARHPNLVAVELSSFKCGHDAPVYAQIEEMVEASGKPFFCFRDLDENRAEGSLALRIETIEHFLRHYGPDDTAHEAVEINSAQ